jgi:hypothetical protein
MRTVNVKSLAQRLDGTGRFGIFRRLKTARVTPSLLDELDRVFTSFARREATRATRGWHQTQREEGVPASDLANATLEYYERARRKLRPFYELDYAAGGTRRTCRYRGVGTFVTWLNRQKRLRPRALKISFLSPAANVVLHLENGPGEGRAHIWAAGDNPLRLESLFLDLKAVVEKAAGKSAAWRSWQANLAYAGGCALVFGVGLSLKLRGLPRFPALGLATLADFSLALGLIFLFRYAWPPVKYDFGDVIGGRGLRYLWRTIYLLVLGAATLGGAWAIFTSFVRLVW